MNNNKHGNKHRILLGVFNFPPKKKKSGVVKFEKGKTTKIFNSIPRNNNFLLTKNKNEKNVH